VPTETLSSGVLELLLSAGPVAKSVLAILLLFSIVSWALIVEKWWQFRRVRGQSVAFLRAFREGRRAAGLVSTARKLRESPLANLYLAGYSEVAGISEIADRVLDEADEGLHADRLEAVNRALRRATGQEIARLERYLPFLATTASVSPFIGLFGTVWGVITAFHGIGQQGSASLAVVAPGISEALIATAAGLGAAIPAVMGYNFFVNRVRHWGTEMDGFVYEFLNVLCRPAPRVARPAKDV
jgi:biopolymer transport protein TolQ